MHVVCHGGSECICSPETACSASGTDDYYNCIMSQVKGFLNDIYL
jgi:hypothetical protein